MRDVDEYLRRNLLHAAALGCEANARYVAGRLRDMSRPPKWLVRYLDSIVERAERVAAEMARHRDEVR